MKRFYTAWERADLLREGLFRQDSPRGVTTVRSPLIWPDPLPLWERAARASAPGEGFLLKQEFAKQLRRDQTNAEYKVWLALRDRRFYGFKFRRQQPIGPYVVDFLCFEEKLVIELDGDQHFSAEAINADAIRTARLGRDGFRVLRFPNSAVTNNLDGVLEEIWIAVGAPKTPAVRHIEEKPFRPSRYVRKKQ